MAETQTPHYPTWVKPDIGGDASNWGNVLNSTLDEIDSVVWANQQAGLPIGSVAMFAGATAPVNWLICDGSSLATAGTYAGLFGIIGYTYGGSAGNFNLPNLLGAFPLGAGTVGLGGTGGEAAHALSVGELAVHAHVVEQTPHSHSAYQNAHNHTIVTGNHSHAIHTGAHSHTYIHTDANHSGIAQGGSLVGAFTDNTSTVGDLGGNTDTAGNLGGYTDTQAPGVGVSANYANINNNATDNAGSGAAHNNLPPYVALNFIIRAM